MSTLNIRPAGREDCSLILAFVRELATYECEPDAVLATEASLRDALFAWPPACECIIGEIDGTPQGFALFFHNFSTWKGVRGVYLEDLYVRPDARGSGLGKALFAHVAHLAVVRGCARYEWAVLDWNEPAIGFYRRMGAIPMNEWTTFRLTGDALRAIANEPKPR